MMSIILFMVVYSSGKCEERQVMEKRVSLLTSSDEKHSFEVTHSSFQTSVDTPIYHTVCCLFVTLYYHIVDGRGQPLNANVFSSYAKRLSTVLGKLRGKGKKIDINSQ